MVSRSFFDFSYLLCNDAVNTNIRVGDSPRRVGGLGGGGYCFRNVLLYLRMIIYTKVFFIRRSPWPKAFGYKNNPPPESPALWTFLWILWWPAMEF